MKRFRQTAAHRPLLNKPGSHAHVRGMPITGVAAPQSPTETRSRGASVRQFGEKKRCTRAGADLREVPLPEAEVL